jgi:pimeloyl-ACP methyl ester carboxylesterase
MAPSPELVRAAVTIPGGTLQARIGGPSGDASDAVVLVHGVAVSSSYLLPVARVLARRRRVCALDLPGYGGSFRPERPLGLRALADALGAALRALGLEPATLLGNSFGCQVIVDLAARGEVDGRLVLAAPTVDPGARSFAAQAARLALDAVREPALVPVVLRDALAIGPRRVLAASRAAVADPLEAKLPRVSAPALVVVGSRDPLVPLGWAERVSALLPAGRLAVIPGAPHATNFSAPGPLAEHVERFLATS